MTENIISAYKAAAKLHGESTRSGNSDKANQAHDELQQLLKQITELGCDKDLQDLFNDEEAWVQLWAAVHTLEVNEKLACQKLQTISDASIPLLSMNARYTLKEWKAGKLKFRT